MSGVHTLIELPVVRFCAIECELQRSGERSVNWMVQAWHHASLVGLPLSVESVEDIARIIEPVKNQDGMRKCGVRVGASVKPDWTDVPRLLELLCRNQDIHSAEAWFYDFEQIHPFRDGNGRTGQILYNLLKGTLDAPVWAPNYWNDPRRLSGDGAP